MDSENKGLTNPTSESAEKLSSSSEPAANSAQDLVEMLLDQWGSMGLLNRQESFSHLSRTDAEELFLRLSTHDQAELLKGMPSLEKRSWIRLLAPDDAADVIQDMGPEFREECLNLLDPRLVER